MLQGGVVDVGVVGSVAVTVRPCFYLDRLGLVVVVEIKRVRWEGGWGRQELWELATFFFVFIALDHDLTLLAPVPI